MCIDKHLDDYMKVKSRPEKSRIVTAIVENIRRGAANSGGGFVRKVSPLLCTYKLKVTNIDRTQASHILVGRTKTIGSPDKTLV